MMRGRWEDGFSLAHQNILPKFRKAPAPETPDKEKGPEGPDRRVSDNNIT
jgi:hypothetical protein